MEGAELVLMLGRWWLYAGAAVAFVFLTIGIDRIDENARGSYIFRPLLVPGVLLIWPVVLWRWLRLEQNNEDPQARYKPVRKAHKSVWLVLGVVIPLLFVTALLIKQTWPTNAPAIQLQEPTGEPQP